MATHPSILAWEILWTEEPGRQQPMGSQRARHNWARTQSVQRFPAAESRTGSMCVSRAPLVFRKDHVVFMCASRAGWNNIFQSCCVSFHWLPTKAGIVTRQLSWQPKEIPCHYSQEIGEPKEITSQTSHSWLAVELLLCLKPVLFKHTAPLSLHGMVKQRDIKAERPSPGASDTHTCHLQTSHLTQEV